MTRFRRYLLTYSTWKTLLNHVFEDLRKPKAPNMNWFQNRLNQPRNRLSRFYNSLHTAFLTWHTGRAGKGRVNSAEAG
jgi:hypothetical protein